MKKVFGALIGLIIILISVIFITYDPILIEKSTVENITKNAVKLDKSDVVVNLKGNITSQISRKKFWFKDKTGQIVVEVKTELVPLVPTSDVIDVEIQGKVDCETNAGEGVKINVDKIILDNQDDEEEELLLQ